MRTRSEDGSRRDDRRGGGKREQASRTGRESGPGRGRSTSPTKRSTRAGSERAGGGESPRRTARPGSAGGSTAKPSAGKKSPATRTRASDSGTPRRSPSKKTEGNAPDAGGTRLNKLIADAGVSSRRAADAMITEGRVRVNGRVVTELGTRVTTNDRVSVDGEIIGDPERHVYVLMNKPKDAITTTKDEKGRRTVLDLLPPRSGRIYPVGRLDRQTTGVLLLTNDGELAARLMHPSYGVERIYDIELDRPLELKDARTIAQGGVDIGRGETTGHSEVIVDDKDRRVVSLLLREGKNREVRRIFESFDYVVVKLHRRAYAGLTTRGLARGEWRHLDRREISALRRLVDLS